MDQSHLAMMDAEHWALPMEGIEHPLNTIRAPKWTFKVNILIVKNMKS